MKIILKNGGAILVTGVVAAFSIAVAYRSIGRAMTQDMNKATTIVEDDAKGWTYEGWAFFTERRSLVDAKKGTYQSGTAHGTAKAGAFAEHTFTGTEVIVTADAGPEGGQCEAFVDGRSYGLYSQKQSVHSPSRTVFHADNLYYGTHKLRLVNRGGGFTSIDYFEYR